MLLGGKGVILFEGDVLVNVCFIVVIDLDGDMCEVWVCMVVVVGEDDLCWLFVDWI